MQHKTNAKTKVSQLKYNILNAGILLLKLVTLQVKPAQDCHTVKFKRSFYL